jgi:hypothetical protein
MRRAHPLDLAAPIALAVITFGALAALTPSRSLTRPHAPSPRAGWQTTPSTWTAPTQRPPAPRAPRAPRTALRRTTTEAPEPQAISSSHSLPDDDSLTQDLWSCSDMTIDFGDDSYGSVSHHRYPGRARYRTLRHARGGDAAGAFPWVGASSQGAPTSLCTLLPSLCGSGGGGAPRRRGTSSPSLVETSAGITLSNADLAIDIARVGACAVRVRRADTGAETLLTFDVPDELVPCEARAVPDVLRDDGVSVRLDAQTPRWSQSITVSLGDDGPAISVARATREGAVTTHRLVNASAHPVTFTVDGLDLAAAPGERLTVTGS